MNPLVSVIIPNYCHSAYLDQRIQSILGQTYQNFEVILLDDCSPDNGASRNVIERYRSNPHVSHIVYNDKNSGSTFRQWDKGISLARGEFIWIAESDDSCESSLLYELVAKLSADLYASVAFCRSIGFDDDKILGPIGPKNMHEGTYSGHVFIHDFMRSGNGIVNASSAVFRKSVYYKVDRRYQSMKGSGDRFFWIEMAEKGNVIFVDKPLNLFRLHSNNSTKKYGATGINQREDKVINDYILQQGYITRQEYLDCKKQYVRVHIFEMIEDRKLKNELYKVWGVSRMDRIGMRFNAWLRKIKRICS